MKTSIKTQKKPLKLIKIKNPPPLLSFMNNIGNDEKPVNLIPLSRIIKKALQREESKETSFCEKPRINIIKKKNKFPISIKNYASNFNKYKSLSYKILPLKQPKLKLPRIKSYEDNSSEQKDSRFVSLINKFNEYDEKFKKKPKFSLDVGEMAYMNYKLKQKLNHNFNYEHIAVKYNYKKVYSKLFKRIKKIQSL